MPWPAWTRPLVVLPLFGHEGADRERRVRSEQLAGQRIHRLTVGAGARIRAVDAAGDVEHRRRRTGPLVDEEIRRLAERVVLRRLMHQPHAVIERELPVHFPVVLHVALDVVVDVFALDALRALRVGAEAADRGVREAERRVARIGPDGVLLEVQRRSAGRAALHLLLVAVLLVEAGLDACAGPRLSSGWPTCRWSTRRSGWESRCWAARWRRGCPRRRSAAAARACRPTSAIRCD